MAIRDSALENNELEQFHDPCAGMGEPEMNLLKETLGKESPCHAHHKKPDVSKKEHKVEDKHKDKAEHKVESKPKDNTNDKPKQKPKPAPKPKPSKKESKCAAFGENCTAKQCCQDPGMQCYEKGWGWSQCRRSCTKGPDPRDVADGGAWSCKELGPRNPGPDCSEPGENCIHSHCCKDIGYQCFEKDSEWGECKTHCLPGVDLTHKDNKPWSCKKLGDFTYGRAPWAAKKCSKSLTECTQTKCCRETGMQCYENVPDFASCSKACKEPWSCKEFGLRTPPNVAESLWGTQGKVKLASWVAEKCSDAGDDCSNSHCCKDNGLQCYEKESGKSAVCQFECTPGRDPTDSDNTPWTCKKFGGRTPGTVDLSHVKPKKVADWVAKKCSDDGKDCTDSKCCKGAAMQCYEKDSSSAFCKASCNPKALELHPWSCKELGPRTPAPWKTPSMFCFAVMRKTGEEPGLMKGQLLKGKGIFSCEEYATFSAGKTKWILGEGPKGVVEVFPFVMAEVGESRDGTAGNAELFMHVWSAVKEHGSWYKHDWTIKVDPDAVIVPERLRMHLKVHTGSNVYLKNCDKQNGMKPMMFGSLEALTRQAMQTYFWGETRCKELEWETWGEDLYMGKCLDMLGVEGKEDLKLVSDGVCRGVDCSSGAAAFHPKKDVQSWMACLAEAEGKKAPKVVKPRTKAKKATKAKSEDDELDDDVADVLAELDI